MCGFVTSAPGFEPAGCDGAVVRLRAAAGFAAVVDTGFSAAAGRVVVAGFAVAVGAGFAATAGRVVVAGFAGDAAPALVFLIEATSLSPVLSCVVMV